MTQSSFVFHEKSEICGGQRVSAGGLRSEPGCRAFDVCPPWMNSSSGGPSSASSFDCSAPMFARSARGRGEQA